MGHTCLKYFLRESRLFRRYEHLKMGTPSHRVCLYLISYSIHLDVRTIVRTLMPRLSLTLTSDVYLFPSVCPFVLSVSLCFLCRLLRFSFRFPAFLHGGFCNKICYFVSALRPPRVPCAHEVCVFPLRVVFCLLEFLMLS